MIDRQNANGAHRNHHNALKMAQKYKLVQMELQTVVQNKWARGL
jgi:hypothetical protein